MEKMGEEWTKGDGIRRYIWFDGANGGREWPANCNVTSIEME